MKLKDIFEVEKNTETHQLYKDTYENLKKYKNNHGYFRREDIFEKVDVESGYARKTYRGKLKDGIEVSELELSMICDSGFSHFGGSSSIGSDRSFTVVIYTD